MRAMVVGNTVCQRCNKLDKIAIELTQREVLGILLALALLVVPFAVSRMPYHGDPEKVPPVTALKARMGLADLNGGLFFSAMVLWGMIFGLLFCGLLWLIWDLVTSAHPATQTEIWDWRFALAKLTALTATLGVVVAFPFTLIRLTLTRRQTETAVEALLNDKIDAAVADLHAQRQVTEWSDDIASNGWQDDVTRRNGAIDRLQGLAEEDPKSAPRIARMLSVYVRELSREYTADPAPETSDPKELRHWAISLRPARSDIQNAAQVLGRLKEVSGQTLENGEIDLREANLQGCGLSDLNFAKALFQDAQLQRASFMNAQLQGANLWDAQLQGAYLGGAQLQRADLRGAQLQRADLGDAQLQRANLWGAQLQHANLRDAQLQGAHLVFAQLQQAYLEGAQFDAATSFDFAALRGAAVKKVDFSDSSIRNNQLAEMFGDASVILPGGHGPDHPDWPEHWSKESLDWVNFRNQWRAVQASIGQDPNAPD